MSCHTCLEEASVFSAEAVALKRNAEQQARTSRKSRFIGTYLFQRRERTIRSLLYIRKVSDQYLHAADAVHWRRRSGLPPCRQRRPSTWLRCRRSPRRKTPP